MALSQNDIKSELSYAYLHAVAAGAGCACEASGRHSDGMGVDARLHVRRWFGPNALRRFGAEVQLKATSEPPTLKGDRFSFWLKAKNYDELRDPTTPLPQLLVVFFLPESPAEWLSCSEDCLIARKCASWVSLYEAPAGSPSGQTVYVPRSNVLSVQALCALLARFAKKERPSYEP